MYIIMGHFSLRTLHRPEQGYDNNRFVLCVCLVYCKMASSAVRFTSAAEKQLNKVRKRQINDTEWKYIKRKSLRDSGQPYISKRNVAVPGKIAVDDVRVCRCKYECQNITLANKQKAFKDFYNLNYDNQTRMLAQQCMDIVNIKRRYVDLKIIPRRLQKLQEKLKFNEPLEDKRGRHLNRPTAIPDTIKDLIKAHIESFSKQESHYARGRTEKLCLSPDLTLKQMFILFKGKHPVVKCSEKLYRDIFRSDFNLRFGTPRSDTCQYCDKFYVKLIEVRSEEEKNNISRESEIHHRRAEKGYSALSDDIKLAKENKNTIVLCTDLQQVLFCPTLKHSSVFYQRQYSCYNQAVHNMGTNDVFWA
ncbi:uncharacterized protein LOC126737611 [Anthonomus grandis grandis]|uniref:uncharacterized protein LOC126737611 n=1 Tax=Anthonomus grandis grandis TaxID=2921223 RepID=UPI0021660CD8|nr:uncharacterized protein LOC126737611 [Anthonomus grandis grandis]